MLACRRFFNTLSSNSQLQAKLQSVLQGFDAPIRYAAAYGSGAFPQKGYENAEAGKHPHHWHSLNLRQNRHHYSFMGSLGAGMVSHVQNSWGGRIYYNPDIMVNGVRIKYGVVSMEHLLTDLTGWETMYLAGRLQKPISILRDDARMRLGSQVNLMNALRVSLLLLPERFTEEELFLKIAGLSYRGDFRMKLNAENPHKVFNIVYAQMDAFRNLYQPIIQDLPNVNYLPDGSLEQDMSDRMRIQLIQALPSNLTDKIKYHFRWYLSRQGVKRVADEEFLQVLVTSQGLESSVTKGIHDIIAIPALTQGIKGLLSAGLNRSIKYSMEKVKKAIKAKT